MFSSSISHFEQTPVGFVCSVSVFTRALSDLLLSPSPIHVQEAIIQIMKMRKRINNAQLQTELVEILKNMFLPQKKMIKEQIEWLIDHKYIKRDETDINTFIYMA